MRIRATFVRFLLPVLMIGGCARQQSAVPDVRAKHLSGPRLAGLLPRSVALVVLDERHPLPPQSGETVGAVRAAVEGALQKSGVAVAETSPNRLTVLLEYPEQLPDTFTNPRHCILARSHIELTKGKAESWSTSCFHSDDALGFPMGTDSTDAFRSALRGSFRGLDRKLSELFRERARADGGGA